MYHLQSFEKVLAQNIQFGLSPSLTNAMESISRWRVLQASLPHLMHACSALLHTRVKDMHQLGAAETKLLYTLHWIFLSAADECSDSDIEDRADKKHKQPYLFSIPTISVSQRALPRVGFFYLLKFLSLAIRLSLCTNCTSFKGV